jgi:hypothetical protein
MKTRILFVIIAWLFASSSVYAACQIEMDQSKNEESFDLRTNAIEVPNQTDDRYGYQLTAFYTHYETRGSRSKNPKLYIYDKNKCQVLKTLELYPRDVFLSGGDYYGVTFNKSAGLIYVTSRAKGYFPDETKRYIYTEIYSYDDLKLINRIEGKTPLARAELTRDGKQVIGFDHVITESEGLKDYIGSHVVIWSSDDFIEIKRSELIDKSNFENLGIQPSGYEIDIIYFENEWFKNKGYDLEFEDQYVIQLGGYDQQGKTRTVEYTLEGKPLLTLWRENGKTIRGYPSDYEKKFNLKINPIQFKDAQPLKKEDKSPHEAVKKKPLSPEPTPAIEPYTRPPSIEEQIAQNRAAKAAHVQQEKQQKQRRIFYIGLAILAVAGVAVAIYLLRRLHQK